MSYLLGIGPYDHDDFAMDDLGDLVIDLDPNDDGSQVGWDFMSCSKYSRGLRRVEMDEPGTHPGDETGSLKEFYMESLREMYPDVPEARLLGSIKDWGYTLEDKYESLRQTIRERMKTTNEDWPLYPRVGADLELFIGENITTINLERIVRRIVATLTRDSLVHPSLLVVQYFRGGPNLILFGIEVEANIKLTVRKVIPFSFVDGPFLMYKEELRGVYSIR